MNNQKSVAFVSLGCAKNLVDSEKMLGQLAEAGCAVTNDESDADVIVINTCGFLDASRREAVEVIREAVGRKKTGRCRRVVVAGCLVQRDGEGLLKHVPGVDALVGVNNRDDVVRAVLNGDGRNRGRGRPDVFLSDYHPFVQTDQARLRLTPRHYAYLRISEGCNQKCTFCTIPSIRGAMHCKPPQVVLNEARELVDDGAVEINLIGQDTTSYGEEFANGYGLDRLLRALDGVDGLSWVRLMYVYPSVMTDAIIDAIATCDRVVKYIDMPLQHINDRVLKAMHRRVTRAETIELLGRLRERIPGVFIRTTMIVGFPGETDAEFDELVAFVEEFGFDALGTFKYSLEPDTPAGRMKGQIPARVKRERYDALMQAQQAVAFQRADALVGRTLSVLVDGADSDGAMVGRHAGQAPTVDGVTYVQGTPRPGEFVTVRCTERRGYDLAGVPTTVPLSVLA
ncbi:MAG: 30S ribosomal protein S12 methylthiotransferase RimO [Phycisphaerales bacterium]|nr:30S ribosomal protein S12 methylthiotransferase RimO [Phycisphaerales bacterium]